MPLKPLRAGWWCHLRLGVIEPDIEAFLVVIDAKLADALCVHIGKRENMVWRLSL